MVRGLLLLLLAAGLLAAQVTASGGWTPAHLIGMSYVKAARDARVQGVVKVECLLKPDGSVSDVKVLSGHPIFIRDVLDNARQWKFAATGKPAAAEPTVILTYEFKLTEPTCDAVYKEQFEYDQPGTVLISSQYRCQQPDAELQKSR